MSAWIEAAHRRYEGPLLRYATRLCRSPEEARDAVQETFLRLCQADRDQVTDHLGPWLYRVCRTRILDVHRKGKPMQPMAETAPSPEPGPAEVAEERQDKSLVAAAVDGLDPLHREVLILKFQEGLSYQEISDVTGKSVSHVGVLIHEGVKRVREALGRTR